MQKGIIKEVNEIAKEGKKTFYEVILQDDAKMSTFDAKIKQGESGDALEFDVIISGKYINLKDGWKLTKQTSSSGPGEKPQHSNSYQMSKEEWVEKQRIERESIEDQVRAKLIVELRVTGAIDDTSNLYQKCLEWLDKLKLDVQLKKARNQAPKQKSADLEQGEESPKSVALAEPEPVEGEPFAQGEGEPSQDESPVSPEQVADLKALIERAKITGTDIGHFCNNKEYGNEWGINELKDLKAWQLALLIDHIKVTKNIA